MVNQVRVAKPPPRKAAPPARKPLSMSGVWLLAIWGATAASAMLIAVLVTHSEVGSQRAAGALSALTGRRVALMQSDQAPVQPATPAAATGIDPQVDSRRLADAVRNLAADNNQLKTRLAAVENNISDFTGSVTRQVEDAKNAAA